jgi:Uma2 family endonuclease
MVAHTARPYWTVEQYFELERTSVVRHEYIDGEVYALAGGTRAHSRLTINLAGLLYNALGDGPCQAYSADMRVQVTPERYVYPDLSVSCAASDRGDGGAAFLTAPCLVIEVLSKGTAAYDRGGKFDFYGQVVSLRDYLLIETERQLVELRHREDSGDWTTQQYGAGEVVELLALGLHLAVDAIYAGIELDAAGQLNLP